VKIQGTACGLGIEGSGWIARDDTVVTNAHVVAGQSDTTVQLAGEGPGLAARAVVFDPGDDLAILRVDGLGGRTLPIADDPQAGASAAILGFPENGPYDVRAGRLGSTRTVITQDAYGRGPVQRSITSLRGTVRPGNSGGPMIDTRGRVVTTVFAAARGGTPGGYGVPNAVVRRDLARAGGGQVSTGPCAR
jgi:S1-C subfamily serine protease